MSVPVTAASALDAPELIERYLGLLDHGDEYGTVTLGLHVYRDRMPDYPRARRMLDAAAAVLDQRAG
jgi:hypothetical protein